MQSYDETSVLADAAYRGDLQVTQLLLSQGAGASCRLTHPRDDGRSVTPLHEAVRGKHVDICRVLCEAAKDYIKTSDILCYAAQRSSGEMCKVLIDSGADVNVKDCIDAMPLHWAASYQSAHICKVLIDAGADVNAKHKAGCTPLHLAAEFQNADVCKVLINAGADVHVKDSVGSTPLHLAKCTDVYRMLINARAYGAGKTVPVTHVM